MRTRDSAHRVHPTIVLRVIVLDGRGVLFALSTMKPGWWRIFPGVELAGTVWSKNLKRSQNGQ